MSVKLDEKDIQILRFLQNNGRLTARAISTMTGIPVTTVFAKVKRLERVGIIKSYRAILDAKTLNSGTLAYVLISFTNRGDGEFSPTQRRVAEQIAVFPEVQEVHIISGDWDIIIKIRASDVESVGKFIIDKLRPIAGIDKTLTCLVFESEKETTSIPV